MNWRFLWALLVIILFVPMNREIVLAQDGAPSWSIPENISHTASDSAYPTIVADPYGTVHVFWTDSLREYANFNNIIYYTRLDKNSWSQPVDILTSPEGLSTMADQPAVVVGSDDRIHLLFVGGFGGQLYYSSADLDDARNSRAWEKPVIISQDITAIGSPNILQDIQGNLHVIYHSESGANQGIYHSTSSNHGNSWSVPGLIPGTTMGSSFIIGDTRAAISSQGDVHVSWMWTNIDEIFPPKGILYKLSTNYGTTWEETSTVVEGPYRYPDLAVVGNNDVLLVWSGTSEDRYKFSQYSTDRGATWSPTIAIKELGGFQGSAGMAVDGSGNLHMGMAASNFLIRRDALIHASWNNRSWSLPEALLLNTHSDNNLQFADIAISEGNIAHIVVMFPIETPSSIISGQSYQFEIYYVQGKLPAEWIAPQNAHSIRPEQNSQEGEPTKQVVVPTPSSISKEVTESSVKTNTIDTSTSIYVGGIPVLVLIILVIVGRRWAQLKR